MDLQMLSYDTFDVCNKNPTKCVHGKIKSFEFKYRCLSDLVTMHKLILYRTQIWPFFVHTNCKRPYFSVVSERTA